MSPGTRGRLLRLQAILVGGLARKIGSQLSIYTLYRDRIVIDVVTWEIFRARLDRSSAPLTLAVSDLWAFSGLVVVLFDG